MIHSKQFFTKYQLPLFFLLSYLLSWWFAPFADGGIVPYGPAFAAVIIIALTAGRTGLREFWGRLTNFRAGWYYLIGLAIIVGYLLAAYVINLLLGATVTNPPHLPAAAVLLQLLFLGGMWEEPGWSGYALPTLQKRFAKHPNGALIATLILGIFRGIWHLPLVIYGAISWYDAIFFALAMQTIISWLYNKTGGSVPVVMFFHYMSNVLIGTTMMLVFSGTDNTTYYVLFVTCAGLVALALAWKSQFKLGWSGTES